MPKIFWKCKKLNYIFLQRAKLQSLWAVSVIRYIYVYDKGFNFASNRLDVLTNMAACAKGAWQ